jgi:hypothetical protein
MDYLHRKLIVLRTAKFNYEFLDGKIHWITNIETKVLQSNAKSLPILTISTIAQLDTLLTSFASSTINTSVITVSDIKISAALLEGLQAECAIESSVSIQSKTETKQSISIRNITETDINLSAILVKSKGNIVAGEVVANAEITTTLLVIEESQFESFNVVGNIDIIKNLVVINPTNVENNVLTAAKIETELLKLEPNTLSEAIITRIDTVCDISEFPVSAIKNIVLPKAIITAALTVFRHGKVKDYFGRTIHSIFGQSIKELSTLEV